MTTPYAPIDFQVTRANWLGRYMAVEKGADQEVYDALVKASKGIDDVLQGLVGNKSKTAALRRLQLALAHKAIRAQMETLFGDVGNTIRAYRSNAAVAAVDAALYDESKILSRIIPDSVQRSIFAKSLRATAQRNIESTIARVLFTQQSLSKRVYKTRALANGQVKRAVNNGLARGDSAENIAKTVRSLINPKVPGGVSYAAKRLARTEINNAFHAQSILDAQSQPWVSSMKWNLSKVHRDDPGDECEQYARQGTFPVEGVPPKPHPNCRCFVTPVLMEDSLIDAQFKMGLYDQYLDDFIAGKFKVLS